MRCYQLLLPTLCVTFTFSFATAGCSSDAASDAAVGSEQPAPEPISLQFIDELPARMGDLPEVDGRLATVADLDGDGKPDIVQPTNAGVRLFWNQGGTFSLDTATIPPPSEGSTNQVLVADFNGDRDPDLFLLNTDGAPLALLLNKGQRSFEHSTAPPLTAPVLAVAGVAVDIDGDGDTDIAMALGATTADDGPATAARALILVNDGKGKFADETAKRLSAPSLEPFAVAAGDIDGDGSADLFFSGDATSHRLLLNDGDGTFRDAPPDALPGTAQPRGRIPVMGDFDADGALDVFVPSGAANTMLINDGHGRLLDETPFALGGQPGKGYSAVAADLDKDGSTDLVVADPGGSLFVGRNDGTGRFFDYSGDIVPTLPEDSDSVSVAAGDIDTDGDLDLFVSRSSLEVPWLLVNRQADGLQDSDDDGVPDETDSCPTEANADQANHDAHHFDCAGATECKAMTGCTLALYDGDKPYLICDTPKPWADARAFCQALGGDLAMVGSKAENDWLASQPIVSAWIGLSDTAVEGTFIWVDGSSIATSYWNDGEPNDSGGSEDCGGMYTSGDTAGKWNDFDCTTSRAFFCQDTSARAPADPGDACDVCPMVYDPDQQDTDGDGVGDTCQTLSRSAAPRSRAAQ